MDHLSAEQIERLRQTLQQERNRLVAAVAEEERSAVADEEVGDIEDKAAEEHRRSTARLVQGHHSSRRAEVEAALRRMEERTYGICEETDEPIPYARLESLPTTRYTVEALELLEDDEDRDRLVRRDDGTNDVY